MNLRNRKYSSDQLKLQKNRNRKRIKSKYQRTSYQKTTVLAPHQQAPPPAKSPAKVPLVNKENDQLLQSNKDVQDKLQELFQNPKYITSYSQYLKSQFSKLDVPSKFKRKLKRFKRRKTKVYGPFNTYQMDLIDYGHIKRSNNGNRYVLIIIDCFTRFVHHRALKMKTAKETALAIESFLNELDTIPKFVYTDAGKEFNNELVTQLFYNRGIVHYILKHGHKASMVERANKTIKSSLELFFAQYWYVKMD